MPLIKTLHYDKVTLYALIMTLHYDKVTLYAPHYDITL